MFHPVGSQSSSVYWRRRLVLLASLAALAVLLVLTVRVVFFSSSGPSAGASGTSSPPTHMSTPTVSPTPTTAASTSPSRSASSSASGSPHGSASSSSAPPARCDVAKLKLAASSEQSHYAMTDQPVLSILVTNPGTAPCVQDLADPQIVLRVYNGESRVWGSHDCKIEPGTDPRTLMAGSTVRVSIVWSGLSSEPNCAGQRQRVGAGTYTLYASLSGREATAAQFTIS